MDRDFDECLAELIEMARERWGEPEYVYYRVEHIWSARDRNHFSLIGSGKECTLEEYLGGVEIGERDGRLAFMGKLKRSYASYRKELRFKSCWPQELIREIERIARGEG